MLATFNPTVLLALLLAISIMALGNCGAFQPLEPEQTPII